ncbi:MAG: 4-hydroxy-3-methylbut-2-enyl diphosphate reductase, partial [Bacteroidales bacterium]|nr:4-hydroxy-3-methylbut-2-enyl diphosphate reductase [Bacteroidales bacterium]
GKKGHAEVVGLVGQTDNNAVVISNEEDIKNIDMTRPVHIFSQTTKNKEDYRRITQLILDKHETKDVTVTDSICKKVSLRAEKLEKFAKSVDCVLFVAGRHSSNGLYLYELCKKFNTHTFFITDTDDIDSEKLKSFEKIGISGATSTPMWLMKKVEKYILSQIQQ